MIVFAHRGASAYETENTSSAIKKAVDMGATAIEFDIQMTKDRKLVLHHDFKIRNSKFYIRNLDFKDLSAATKGAYVIERLETILQIIPKKIFVNIEIKSQMRHRQRIEEELLILLEKYNRLENTIISSFDHHCIKRIYKLNQNIKVGLLFHARPINIRSYIKNSGIDPYCLNFSVKSIDKELVDSVHSCESKVFVYTVNDLTTAKKLENLGVDGIFSDHPDILK